MEKLLFFLNVILMLLLCKHVFNADKSDDEVQLGIFSFVEKLRKDK